jgi:hypothetical protein
VGLMIEGHTEFYPRDVGLAVSFRRQFCLTVIRLIRISCGIPGFYPYKMPRGFRRKDHQAFHFNGLPPVQRFILAYYAGQHSSTVDLTV